MEWVETTGRTVDEAKEAALDELGVDEADAEFEVVAEPQTGLFGRLRSEARVRARVMPTAPRAKEERRDRRRRSGSQGSRASVGSGGSGSSSGGTTGAEQPRTATSNPHPANAAVEEESPATPTSGDSSEAPDKPRPARPRDRGGNRNADRARAADQIESKGAQVEVALEDQASIAEGFLADLTAEFGLSVSVTQTNPDEETVELQLTGSDLGILIGPKGSTLVALQHLTRTVVHHETGATNGHLNVDVGGYRHKRTEALTRFATEVANSVKESGNRTALEPMSAVDRKVVHDTIGEIDGVATISEGEEPGRRVVVLPAPAAG